MINNKKITLTLYLFFLFTAFLQLAFVGNLALHSVWFYILYITSLLLVSSIFVINYLLENIENKNNSIQIQNTEKEINQSFTEIETTISINETDTKDFSIMIPSLTSQTELTEFADSLLKNIAKEINFAKALFYYKNSSETFVCCAQYAYFNDKLPDDFKIGENLTGQAVKNKIIVALEHIPENYIPIVSGLGKSSPNQIVFVPLIFKDEVIGLIEYSSFEILTDKIKKELEIFSENVAEVIVKLVKKQK